MRSFCPTNEKTMRGPDCRDTFGGGAAAANCQSAPRICCHANWREIVPKRSNCVPSDRRTAGSSAYPEEGMSPRLVFKSRVSPTTDPSFDHRPNPRSRVNRNLTEVKDNRKMTSTSNHADLESGYLANTTRKDCETYQSTVLPASAVDFDP